MKNLIEAMCNQTDLYPWYWLSYGEKCYAFAVVEAYPATYGEKYPEPGTHLEPNEDDNTLWVGENGVNVIIESEIANIEAQNGDTICRFIAGAHSLLMREYLPEFN